MKLPAGYVPGEGVYKATAYGGFGERLLKKMGWEGRGLGINQHGMQKAIEVKKKEDQTGVGGKAGFAWEKKWWEEAYDSKLQKLQAEGSDSDSSDDELTTYTNRDGTQSSATAAELKLAAELSKDPWGRFGGRAGKMARIRAQEAQKLAAMQGSVSGTCTVTGDTEAKTPSGSKKKRKAAAEHKVLPGPTSKTRRLSSAANGSIDSVRNSACSPAEAAATPELVQSKVKRRGEKAGKKAAVDSSEAEGAGPGEDGQKRKARVVHLVAAAEAPSLAQFQATPRLGWWGASRFASAGCLEGLEHTAGLVAKQRQTFTEQTQEDLYLSTHAGKSSAKKGLGSSSAPRNVGGTSWKGQKTVFADEEHAPSSAEPVATDTHAGAAKPGGGQGDSAESILQKAQWKKIARRLLKEAEGGTMELAQLQREAIKAALCGQKARKAVRTQAGRTLLRKLMASKTFKVCEDRISWVSRV